MREAGLDPCSAMLFSAHQMGSCRMGHSPATSVLDEDGEAWDADGLWVFDDSTFPTASGANPMVTTLAISHMLSTRLTRRLAGKESAEAVEARRARRDGGRRERGAARRRARAAAVAKAAPCAAALLALLVARAWWGVGSE